MLDDYRDHETYEEYVGRYRIIRHEEMDDRRKAEYRLNGIDPDDCWSLIWSFDDEDAANKKYEACIKNKVADCWTYKLVDAGEATTITRAVWF